MGGTAVFILDVTDYGKIELLQIMQQLEIKAVVRLSATSCRFMSQMNWLQIQLVHFLYKFILGNLAGDAK